MSRWNLAWLITVPMMVLTGLVLSYAAPNRDKDKDYKLVKTIVDVLAEVDSKFYRDLNDDERKKLVENMINGGLERLDRYSTYMNDEELKQFESQTEGNFFGVGIQIGTDPKSGYLMVLSPMVGTPAYEAGILAGDTIIKIDDKSTENMRIGDAVKLIQGKEGTNVKLTVVHEGARESEAINITRARIEVYSVLGFKRKEEDPKQWDWFVEDGIAYIRIVQFIDHTTADLRKAVEIAEQAGAKGIVLDLRDNPGGLLSSAIEVSDTFLTEGAIVSTRDRNNRGRKWDAKEDGTLFKGKPIAVLINKNSASASEIVSAALQDNKRAVIVGDRSFGKGSVQKIIKLETTPATALKLTTDTYWRPSGVNIHRKEDADEKDDWGVRPDKGYEVVLKPEEHLEYMKFRRSRDMVKGKNVPKEEPKKDEKKEAAPFRDRALDAAVEYLKKQTS
ncbi:MAG: S41 family peptidase [Planctomycetes bacterium]|nr:S41 family peptidase [Planctomycetota bacterium]